MRVHYELIVGSSESMRMRMLLSLLDFFFPFLSVSLSRSMLQYIPALNALLARESIQPSPLSSSSFQRLTFVFDRQDAPLCSTICICNPTVDKISLAELVPFRIPT